MPSSPPSSGAKPASALQLPIEFQKRLDNLVLRASRALSRDVTRAEVLFVVLGLGLASAEERTDFARRVRDAHVPPRRGKTPYQRRAAPRSAPAGDGRVHRRDDGAVGSRGESASPRGASGRVKASRMP